MKLSYSIKNHFTILVASLDDSKSSVYEWLSDYKKNLAPLSKFITNYKDRMDQAVSMFEDTEFKDHIATLLYQSFLDLRVHFVSLDKLTKSHKLDETDIVLLDYNGLKDENIYSKIKFLFQEDKEAESEYSVVVYTESNSLEKITHEKNIDISSTIKNIDGILRYKNSNEFFTELFFYVKSKVNALKLNRVCLGLRKISHTDELTGLYNMRAYWSLYSQTLMRCRKENKSFGIIMIDIDNFKSINDTYYHMVGSLTLSEVGQILKGHMTKDHSCYVSRYGGDEYLSVMEMDSKDKFFDFVKQLKHELSSHIYLKGSYNIRLTVSIGAVYVSGYEAFSGEDPIKLADLLLFRSKIMGKDRISKCFIKDKNETEHKIKTIAEEIIKKSDYEVKLESLRAVAFNGRDDLEIDVANVSKELEELNNITDLKEIGDLKEKEEETSYKTNKEYKRVS